MLLTIRVLSSHRLYYRLRLKEKSISVSGITREWVLVKVQLKWSSIIKGKRCKNCWKPDWKRKRKSVGQSALKNWKTGHKNKARLSLLVIILSQCLKITSQFAYLRTYHWM
jgi:hypothetical protein